MKKLLIVCVLAVLLLVSCKEKPIPESEPVSSEPSSVAPPPSSVSSSPESEEDDFEENIIEYPVGKIGTNGFIDHDRETYDGTMYLEVPAMNFEGIVLDGTTLDVLKNGVGLFPQGQLPGRENRNVSIAGHRDIDGGPFMDIDKIGEGDLFYLTYQNKRYTYKYVETMITAPDDWTAVRVKEYSAITLQSCDPPWVLNSSRIFAIGRLIAIEDVGDESEKELAA